MSDTHAMKVLNENDPYLREIWAMGYTHVVNDCGDMVLHRSDDGYKKIIRPHTSLMQQPLTIKRALLYNGKIHEWISEADGSAKRFRELIEPEKGFEGPRY